MPRNITPFGPLERILRPVIGDAVGVAGQAQPWLHGLEPPAGAGPGAPSRRRISGQSSSSGRAGGFVAAVGAVVLFGAAGRFSPLLAVVLVLGSAVGGFLFRDYLLGVQIRKREARMMAEFPSIAELMALAVSAGESATGALDRVCRSARGELSKEFTRVLAETRAGKPLVEALQEFSSRTDLGPLLRFVDGIIVAVERGTPLADVLRAQAQDVRDTAKRELMESAGKKEIAMMVPRRLRRPAADGRVRRLPRPGRHQPGTVERRRTGNRTARKQQDQTTEPPTQRGEQ